MRNDPELGLMKNSNLMRHVENSEMSQSNYNNLKCTDYRNFIVEGTKNDEHEAAEQGLMLLQGSMLLKNGPWTPTDTKNADVNVFKKPGENKWKKYLSLILALVAAMLFALSALIIKVLNYNPFKLHLWRCLVIIFIPIPFLAHAIFYKNQNILKPLWPINSTTFYLGMQAVVGTNSFILLFYAMQRLSVADAIVITTSAPVFVAILAFIFLKEKCAVFPIFAAVLTIVGVIIISRPPMLTGKSHLDESLMIGVMISFGSTMCTASCYVIIRHLRTVHHALVNLCLGCFGLFESFVMGMFLGVIEYPTDLKEVSLIVASGFLSFFAQTCITLALKYEQAGPVSLIRTSEVFFAFVWQLIFLGVRPDLFSIIGAVIVVTTVVLTALRKIISTLPENHKYRKICCLILL